MPRIKNMGVSDEMNTCLQSIAFAAKYFDQPELKTVRDQIEALKGPVFVEGTRHVNQVLVKNIEFRMLEPGEAIYRLRMFSKENNVNWQPGHDLAKEYNEFLDKGGLLDPVDNEVGPDAYKGKAPVYNPYGNEQAIPDPTKVMQGVPRQPADFAKAQEPMRRNSFKGGQLPGLPPGGSFSQVGI